MIQNTDAITKYHKVSAFYNLCSIKKCSYCQHECDEKGFKTPTTYKIITVITLEWFCFHSVLFVFIRISLGCLVFQQSNDFFLLEFSVQQFLSFQFFFISLKENNHMCIQNVAIFHYKMTRKCLS